MVSPAHCFFLTQKLLNMNTLIIQNTENVEIVLSSLRQKYLLPSQNNFREKKVRDIILNTEMKFAPSGRQIHDSTVFSKAFLTLDIKGKEKIKQLPLFNLVDNMNIAGRRFDNIVINPDKSYIEISEMSGINDDQVILLTFIYDD